MPLAGCPPMLASAMVIPLRIAVVPGSIPPVAEFDVIATLMLVVLAAGVGWFLWRRK